MTGRHVENLDIWRAAQQLIKRYPDEPEFAACQRADAAYETGDMFNFELWQRVARAVRELLSKSATGEARRY